MHWQFHYPKRIAFYPLDYETPGLGGSEAVLVLLTRELARRGHDVEVFCCCYKPGIYDGVRWRMAWEIDDANAPDVGVALRFEEALWPHLRSARRQLFWMLDDRTSGAKAFAEEYHNSGGTIVAASNAMLRRLARAEVSADCVLIYHPIDVHHYAVDRPRLPACLFCSMPNRGLDIALSLWPGIKQRVPSAELWVTSGWELWGYMRAEAEDRWREITGLEPLPDGVSLFKAVSRSHLQRLQETAWINLYPSRFPEMFCLAVAECAAAGTPSVTSDLEALSERVVDGTTGFLINGCIDDASVQHSFIDAAVTLMTNAHLRHAYGQNARRLAEAYAVEKVALAWEQLVQSGN